MVRSMLITRNYVAGRVITRVIGGLQHGDAVKLVSITQLRNHPGYRV